MDVRCQRCSTEYDFDEARIPPQGLAVKCSSCGNVFRVYRGNADGAAAADGQWQIRRADGRLVQFKEMTTLQRWIVERKVTRNDEISKGGKAWKRLGDIAELAPFFQAVAQPVLPPTSIVAVPPESARWEDDGKELSEVESSGAWLLGEDSRADRALAAARRGPQGQEDRRSTAERRPPASAPPPPPDDDLEIRPRGNRVKWIALAVVAALGGALGGAFYFRPPWLARLWRPEVNELAQSHVRAGEAELLRDSYAAIEKARAQFEKAVALDANFAEAKADLAQAELNRAEYLAEEATELAAKVASLPAAEQPAAQSEVDKRRKEFSERTDRAFSLGKEALTLAPESVLTNRVMADYYRVMRAPDTMKPLLERARAAATQDPGVAYVQGASVAPDATLAERAIRYFDEALEANPGLNRARYQLARVFLAQGNTQKALMHAETVLKSAPEHDRALALVRLLKPEPVAAAPTPPPLPPVPEKKELSAEQLVALAERLRESDQSRKALNTYQRALEMAADDPDILTGIGWCYIDLEEPAPAVQSFKAALQVAPRLTDAHMGLAEAYRMRGMKRDAIAHYRVYLDILPDGPEAAIAKRMVEQLNQAP